MEEYVKIILYTYPFLRTVGKDYEEHIRNKAILSYKSRLSTEALAEEIAREILEQRKLLYLKEKADEVIAKLTEIDKLLLQIRYFGQKRKLPLLEEKLCSSEGEKWSERKYFRRQERLGGKLGGLFSFVGLTKELFEKEYSLLDIFKPAKCFLKEGREETCKQGEKIIRPYRKEDGGEA